MCKTCEYTQTTSTLADVISDFISFLGAQEGGTSSSIGYFCREQ